MPPKDVITCLACQQPTRTRWATATDIEYFTTSDSFGYYRCDACEALSIEPVPLDRLHEIYPENYYSYRPGFSSPIQRIKNALDRYRFRALLRRISSPSIDVLDVGGGYGQALNLVRSADSRVESTTIVDFDKNAKAEAEARGHLFWLGRFEEFSWHKRFHLILLLNLIEHVADPLATLEHARSRLHPGGLIYLQTPNYDSLDATLFRNHSWGGFHCPRHWVLFNRRAITSLCVRAGLDVIGFDYIQGAPFWAWSAMNALRALRWVHFDAGRPVAYHPLTHVLTAVFAAFDMVRSKVSPTSQMLLVLRERHSVTVS